MMAISASLVRSFFALVWLSMRRQWRIKALGWTTLALTFLLVATVGVISKTRGWKFEDRWSGRLRTSFRNYEQQLEQIQSLPLPGNGTAISMAAFSPFRSQLADPIFRAEFELTHFVRWVVFAVYLGFLLPLINLAFASGAMGDERESRTLIWLQTRPIPRPLIFLGKWLGVLPWCVLVSLGSFAAICQAGGAVGRESFSHYWFVIFLGSVSLSALFHLLGSTISRPTVIGLAYIFFFETLVANLPGSLKLMSMNFYVKSLIYNILATRVHALTPESVEIYAPADSITCIVTLLISACVFLLIGMFIFSKYELTEVSS